jgi:antitoxin VapB
MALNIKDPVTEQLARDVAELTGESLTAAVRTALDERKRRLELAGRPPQDGVDLHRLLRERIWPLIPEDVLGKAPSQAEQDAILGYDEPLA